MLLSLCKFHVYVLVFSSVLPEDTLRHKTFSLFERPQREGHRPFRSKHPVIFANSTSKDKVRITTSSKFHNFAPRSLRTGHGVLVRPSRTPNSKQNLLLKIHRACRFTFLGFYIWTKHTLLCCPPISLPYGSFFFSFCRSVYGTSVPFSNPR